MDERRLAEYLSAQADEPVEVHGVRRLASGHSRTVHLVDSSAGRFVVRMQVDGAAGMSAAAEFDLTQSLGDARFPVPKVRWSEPTGDVLGQPFFVVDHVEADPVDDEPASASAVALVQTLARLHGLKPEAHLPVGNSEQATAIQIEYWRSVGKSAGGSRVPLLDAAEMWLHKSVPLAKRAVLVHGGPAPSNASIIDGAVVAITDWDAAHVGNPAEDWSYLATRDGSAVKSREWRALIEREAEVRISADEWSYWEAFNLFKRACVNRTYLAQFERGTNRSPSMAIAGTAVYHSLLRRLMHLVAVT
jgi:aminoglycoside phosphotransferase (APT) family kinase protein